MFTWKRYKSIYLLSYGLNNAIDIMVRVFANGPGDLSSIPGGAILKTQKMVLDAPLLPIQHYKVQIKGKVGQSWEMSSTLPYTLVVVAIEKGAFGSPSITVANFTYLLFLKVGLSIK